MKKKIFIDGKAGTTGLRIYERLSARADADILSLPDELRKDPESRAQAIKDADVAFLCLPDAAAREAVALAGDADTVIIDASTAHRTAEGWTYGFPELGKENAAAVAASRRIAVPGCHASGFVALVAPLVRAGVLPADTRLVCHSLTGYSGGGKSMIEQYRTSDGALRAPRQYGLGQAHKHLPEMVKISGVTTAPAFCPVVCDFYSGMEVTVPLFVQDLAEGCGAEDVKDVYRKLYDGEVVFYRENCDEDGFLSAGAWSDTDAMEISVHGNDERILLTARYDNLGKGASGAAVECMNLALGLPATYGLELKRKA